MENPEILEENIKKSFSKVKSEMQELRDIIDRQSELIEELDMNQSVLLDRIKKIEQKQKKDVP
jgi:hypothetical protein